MVRETRRAASAVGSRPLKSCPWVPRARREPQRMTTALIGNTGFVGSNLARQFDFDDVYNSSNIADIAGKSYDLVVSAGARADAHWVNTHADVDRASIDALINTLSRATIETLVLISTVCIYPALPRCDENTVVDADRLAPYGRN